MAAVPVLPNVAETGRVLAELNDWRSIIYMCFALIVVMVIERFWANHKIQQERDRMWEVAKLYGESSKEMTNALNGLTVEFKAARLVASRMEAVAADAGK